METRQFTQKVPTNVQPTDRRLTNRRGRMDFLLFCVILGLCLFGLIMVFSASYYYSLNYKGTPFFYIKKQVIFFVIGLICMLFLANMKSYQWLRKWSFWIYFATLIMLVCVLLFGVMLNGARRWLDFGVTTFQPSELCKFTLVNILAAFMASNPERMRLPLKQQTKGLLPAVIIIVAGFALVFFQPNMSMAAILAVTGFAMLFIGGTKWQYLVALMVIGIVAIILLALSKEYRMDRIDTFINPNADLAGKGYQLAQSKYALGSGGLFGTGLNMSKQKLLFLTYAESDCIFAIIGEEFGFVGSLLVISAYFFIIRKGIIIAMKCRSRFGSLLAAGITMILALQVVLNIAINCGAFPTTGQTLPFISSGGTSLIIFMSAMGILLNISRDIVK